MIRDISIHFSLKNNSLEDVKKAIKKLVESNPHIDLSGDTEMPTTLHHCFLTKEQCKEKGISTDVVDFISSLGKQEVRWNPVSDNLEESRRLMFQNLARVNGKCYFFGDIEAEGVNQEYKFAGVYNNQTILCAVGVL